MDGRDASTDGSQHVDEQHIPYEKIEDGRETMSNPPSQSHIEPGQYYQLSEGQHQPDIEMVQLNNREKPSPPSSTIVNITPTPKIPSTPKQKTGGGGIQSILITDKSKIQLVSTIKPLSPFIRIVNSIPVLLVLSLFGYSYYVYVVLLIVPWLHDTEFGWVIGGSIALFCYHVCLAITLISYFRCSFGDPGYVPNELTLEEAERNSYAIAKNEPTICGLCNRPKPDRCHHCRSCNRCILRMDHHCPWINNCVGWYNLKFFLLFCGWTSFTCIISTIFGLIGCSRIGWANVSLQIVALLLIGMMVGGVLCFFTTMHIMLVRVNMTTIEMIGKGKKKEHGKVTTESIRPEETEEDSWLIACCPFCSPSVNKHVWNVGKEKNFTQIFGEDRLLWLLPVFTSDGDGVHFPYQNV
eukprot:TRINITY_DN13198_c0_g1_i1.p1 TRINITY_DN13198_c0_g1~~TRINITY_DN13198_c0_g1_i1.p1  ORF type:complete len:410 (-),score=46.96 TRINITY_DN13198_c0_g1_i1:32-1261(-)